MSLWVRYLFHHSSMALTTCGESITVRRKSVCHFGRSAFIYCRSRT
jgi:hypothetical protein